MIDLGLSGHIDATSIISYWAAALPPKAGFIQEGIGAFFLAHVFLGRLAGDLPAKTFQLTDPAATALVACADILYWSNRMDLDELARRQACQSSLDALNRHEVGAGVNAIMSCDNNFELQHLHSTKDREPGITTIAGVFPEEVAEICRQALQRPAGQVSYEGFPYVNAKQTIQFALRMIGAHGSSRDVLLLKQLYAGDAELGPTAVDAIKDLETRLNSAQL